MFHDYLIGKWMVIGALQARLSLSGFRSGLQQTRDEIAATHGEGPEAKRLDEILFGFDEEVRTLNATATATPA